MATTTITSEEEQPKTKAPTNTMAMSGVVPTHSTLGTSKKQEAPASAAKKPREINFDCFLSHKRGRC